MFNLAKGRYVIVRSYSEGLNFGKILEYDKAGVVLEDARRIWYYKPARELSDWYEGVALHGLHKNSRMSPAVKFKEIIENYSITHCSDVAIENMKNFISHCQISAGHGDGSGSSPGRGESGGCGYGGGSTAFDRHKKGYGKGQSCHEFENGEGQSIVSVIYYE